MAAGSAVEPDGREGRVGSKKPWECCRRWLFPSVPIKGEFLRDGSSLSLAVWGSADRGELLIDVELALELGGKWAIEGRWNAACGYGEFWVPLESAAT